VKLTPSSSLSLAIAVLVTAVLATVGFGVPPRVAPAAAQSAAALSADAPFADRSADVVPQVDVIERAAWGAVAGRGAEIGQVDEVVIHHFWRPSLAEVVPAAREAQLLRQVEKTHVEDNGWSGFGYSFVVFQSGRVYEGRGWGREGAHTTGENDRTIGIAFAIDGDQDEPTAEAWAAAKALIEDGVAQGHLTDDVVVSGHADYAPKSCPGRLVAPRLQELAPDAA
jgi:N-acetylmuramoyl-L-alanine amidase